MRLRQLSRKLGVHPDKILHVLADSGHELDNEANAKLTPEQLELVITVYPVPEEKDDKQADQQPATELETTAAEHVMIPEKEELIEETVVVTEQPAPETPPVLTEETSNLEHLEVPFGPPAHTTSQIGTMVDETTEEETVEEKPAKRVIQLEKPKPAVKVYNAIEEDEEFLKAELIKTEKPVLEGLKVLGKIELPEPKKPVEKTAEEIEQEQAEKEERKNDRRSNRRNDRDGNRKGRNRKPRLSPLEYERQKAQKLAKKKKLEAQKKQKEKKEQHYRETLEAKARSKRKAKATIKPAKKAVKREEEAMAPLPINGASRQKPVVQKKKKPGAIKRFWSWLNGESDKFA